MDVELVEPPWYCHLRFLINVLSKHGRVLVSGSLNRW